MSAVGARRRVKDQRTDSVLVDDDLMQAVVEHLGAVTEPVDVGVGPARDDAVEARHLSLRHVDVRRDLTERRTEVSLRHAAQLTVDALIARTATNNKQLINQSIYLQGGPKKWHHFCTP